jgi:hypothetical protein
MASGSHRSGSNPSSSQGTWWDVVEIVEEDAKRYRVRWAGKDPKTGKPWPLDWVPNSHCSLDLIRDWEKKRGAISTIAPPGHIHIRNNTGKAKKQDSLASPSLSKSSVAFKRPSENRNATSTSKPPIPTTSKRKHSTLSGSPDNADDDSALSRRKRLAAAVESITSGSHGGQSTAPAHALPNRKDRPTTTGDLPSRPPLEEIEMWVPTANAKFGPPKRKRTAGERRDPPKEGPVDIAVPAKTPVPTPIPLPLALSGFHLPTPRGTGQTLPSLSRPLPPTESQIVALREEEEESQPQSLPQPTSNQPGGTINDSATSDPLPPTVRDAKDDIQPTKLNVNNGRSSEPSGQGAYSQSNVPDPIMQVSGVTDDSPGYPFNPLLPSPMSLFNPNPSASANSSSKSPQMEKSMQGKGVNTEDTHRFDPRVMIPVFNFNPSASAISSSKSPQIEKSVKIGPPRIRKPGTSPTKRHSPSRSEPPRSGDGTLAKRRAFEARVRLDELRRAGKRFGNIAAKGHPNLETSQSSEQPPPHVVFKQVIDGMESPSGSQVTHLGNSANEISASASPGGLRKADPSKSLEGLVINKSGKDANTGSLSQTGGVLAANVLVVRGDVATRRATPC